MNNYIYIYIYIYIYTLSLLTAICNTPCGTNKVCSAPNNCGLCANGHGPLPDCPCKISIIGIKSNIVSLQLI